MIEDSKHTRRLLTFRVPTSRSDTPLHINSSRVTLSSLVHVCISCHLWQAWQSLALRPFIVSILSSRLAFYSLTLSTCLNLSHGFCARSSCFCALATPLSHLPCPPLYPSPRDAADVAFEVGSLDVVHVPRLLPHVPSPRDADPGLCITTSISFVDKVAAYRMSLP
ncbi:hypothetical protein B0H19DRAFT_1274771 [Mycena capillaripes]|nr:hypothetical protein B0H19DRAFT_1274771 [Mycena capillaripes]